MVTVIRRALIATAAFLAVTIASHVLITAGDPVHCVVHTVLAGLFAGLITAYYLRQTRAVEQRQQVFVSELHHNVNNALQVLMCRDNLPVAEREAAISQACQRISAAVRLTSSLTDSGLKVKATSAH